jgi:hypothetical protein
LEGGEINTKKLQLNKPISTTATIYYYLFGNICTAFVLPPTVAEVKQ